MRRSLLLLASLLIACGKGDKPPPPSSNALLTQESGPSSGGNGPRPVIQQTDNDPATIYANQCAMCHGKEGHGDGISAGALSVKPRDYSDPKWQASVTDDDIKRVIVLGGKGTGKSPSMPDNPTLKNQPATLDGLVKIIRGFAKK